MKRRYHFIADALQARDEDYINHNSSEETQ